MSLSMDQSSAVRPGEELPTDRLEMYLAQKLPQFAGAVTVEQFPHGHSNLTYLIRIGDTELVLRRPPFGNQVKTAHDMGREYRVLIKLCDVYPPAPRPYLYCDDESVLGSPFYVMERRTGIILRKAPPRGMSLNAETMRRLSIALIDNLAQLHAIDYSAAGLGDLGKPVGFVARQVSGWINRYTNAQTDTHATMDRVAGWLTDHVPAESRAAVIHNDYKFDNLVLDPADPAHIVAVLDWEMATIGDPWMDLGTTLGYWIEPKDPPSLQAAAMGPTTLPGCLSRREFVDRYQAATGCNIAEPTFYYSFGLYKIAVIIQHIYARFVRGHTQDARFARFNELVAVLAQQADNVIETGKIS